jgi:hypothetical protein
LQVGETAGVEAATRERRIDLQALVHGIHHVTIAIHLEGAGARVGQRTVVRKDEHALPAQREVQVRVGELDVALCELLRDRGHAHAVAAGVARHTLQRHREHVRELVREPLKPVVEVLAMLLAVTLRSACAAFSPERAMRNGMEETP